MQYPLKTPQKDEQDKGEMQSFFLSAYFMRIRHLTPRSNLAQLGRRVCACRRRGKSI